MNFVEGRLVERSALDGAALGADVLGSDVLGAGSGALAFLADGESGGESGGAGGSEAGGAGAGGFALALPSAQAERLAGHAGQRVSLGIRPEAFHVAGSATAPSGAAVSRWRVDVVEPMGNEVVLYVSRGPHRVVGRVAPQVLPEPGAWVDLAVDPRRLHFFDAASGETLATQIDPASQAA